VHTYPFHENIKFLLLVLDIKEQKDSKKAKIQASQSNVVVNCDVGVVRLLTLDMYRRIVRRSMMKGKGYIFPFHSPVADCDEL
jgi:hypothetical protein